MCNALEKSADCQYTHACVQFQFQRALTDKNKKRRNGLFMLSADFLKFTIVYVGNARCFVWV